MYVSIFGGRSVVIFGDRSVVIFGGRSVTVFGVSLWTDLVIKSVTIFPYCVWRADLHLLTKVI